MVSSSVPVLLSLLDCLLSVQLYYLDGRGEAMKIGPWVARKRKAFWQARFAVAVANCNARMISRSQHITD